MKLRKFKCLVNEDGLDDFGYPGMVLGATSMRLSTEAIKIVNTMAENENRNFTNMVETLIFRAGQRKQKMIR